MVDSTGGSISGCRKDSVMTESEKYIKLKLHINYKAYHNYTTSNHNSVCLLFLIVISESVGHCDYF